MEPTRFMRIPFFVTGYQVTEENMNDLAKWCNGHVVPDTDKSFISVPVNRPTNQKQTQAYPGMWIILSMQRGIRSFKVYTEEWLQKQFLEMPHEPTDPGIRADDSSDDANRIPNNIRPIPTQRRPINNIRVTS